MVNSNSVAIVPMIREWPLLETYGVEKVYQEIDEVFKDPEVDIIYISTPHNTHINFFAKALAAGKHVLCEKSITLN